MPKAQQHTMKSIENLNYNLKQNWSRCGYNNQIRDQYGTIISGFVGNYTLICGEYQLKNLRSINTAKELSKILINDKFINNAN